MLVPLLASKAFGESVSTIGLLSSSASLAGVAGSLIWGRLSDAAHRRKPFIVTSYAAVCICFFGLLWARSIGAVLLFNIALSFFWIANASVSVLLVIENQPDNLWEAKISVLNQFGAFGWLLGLVMGSVGLSVLAGRLDERDAIQSLFVVLGLGAGAAASLALALVPRTRAKYIQRSFRGLRTAVGNFLVETGRFTPQHLYHRFSPRALPKLFFSTEGLRPRTKLFLLSTFIAFVGIGFYAIPLPLLLTERFGISSSSTFLLYAALHGGIVIAYPFASHRIWRAGNRRVQMGALAVRVVLFFVAALYLIWTVNSPPTVVLVLFLLVVGATWSYFQLSGIALASRLAKPEFRGQALGLYNAISGMGTIAAGVSSGYVARIIGYATTYLIAAGLLLIAMLILVRLPDPAFVLAEHAVDDPHADSKPIRSSAPSSAIPQDEPSASNR